MLTGDETLVSIFLQALRFAMKVTKGRGRKNSSKLGSSLT